MTLNSHNREPPVQVAEETHGSRNQQSAHKGGIEYDCQRHTKAERLDEYHIGWGKRSAHYNNNDGFTGNNATASLQTQCDGMRVIAGLPESFLHSREQKHFVVHRETEQGKEEQNRTR